MRPYPNKNLPRENRIFNYRLSRARNTIENSFGILAARWRVLLQVIHMYPNTVEKITLAAITLHNFIKLTDASFYQPERYADWLDENGDIRNGTWRSETAPLPSMSDQGSHNATTTAFRVRNELTGFFNNEGAVPWQNDSI